MCMGNENRPPTCNYCLHATRKHKIRALRNSLVFVLSQPHPTETSSRSSAARPDLRPTRLKKLYQIQQPEKKSHQLPIQPPPHPAKSCLLRTKVREQQRQLLQAQPTSGLLQPCQQKQKEQKQEVEDLPTNLAGSEQNKIGKVCRAAGLVPLDIDKVLHFESRHASPRLPHQFVGRSMKAQSNLISTNKLVRLAASKRTAHLHTSEDDYDEPDTSVFRSNLKYAQCQTQESTNLEKKFIFPMHLDTQPTLDDKATAIDFRQNPIPKDVPFHSKGKVNVNKNNNKSTDISRSVYSGEMIYSSFKNQENEAINFQQYRSDAIHDNMTKQSGVSSISFPKSNVTFVKEERGNGAMEKTLPFLIVMATLWLQSWIPLRIFKTFGSFFGDMRRKNPSSCHSSLKKSHMSRADARLGLVKLSRRFGLERSSLSLVISATKFLVLLTLVSASEFPDRECCDSVPPPPPHYHSVTSTTTTSTPPPPHYRLNSSGSRLGEFLFEEIVKFIC